ncbi:ParB N-terminal domain-containing protein [Rhodobacteraceae bacterium DSL-40]|uniref:ParB/RepB/Spo0J family partition protein n=1 Tax=Amaricoccus sp. B4 TaxID=3368557 RepID=UPI000DAF2E94
MSKRRRMFDIEMPDQEPETFPAGKSEPPAKPEAPAARRGPMAAAITETAVSVRERREVEDRIRAENDALAHEFVRLKKLGLAVELVPLEQVEARKLTRDRAAGPDEELSELKDSIQAIGLSNPIRVERRADGRFELIQGFRRLAAYRELLGETGDPARFGAIPAAVSEAGDSLDALYRRMVDENLVRKDISFAEMAQLAREYAADPDTGENDPDKAVAVLFKSAGYQKRSYIRTFIRLVERLGAQLRFAPEISRALGLALVARMDEDPEVAARILDDLTGWEGRTAQDELAVLRRHARIEEAAEPARVPAPAAPAAPAKPGRAKTSFQFDRPEGRAKCTAAAGRLEVRLDRDFSTVDRRRLERAVRQMLDQLDG